MYVILSGVLSCFVESVYVILCPIAWSFSFFRFLRFAFSIPHEHPHWQALSRLRCPSKRLIRQVSPQRLHPLLFTGI